MKRIVVGVDGSEHSLDALRWAVEEARLRDAKVVAVHAWSLPHVSTASEALNVLETHLEQYRAAARKLLETAVEEAVPEADDVEIARVVTEGSPAPALLDAAQGADLLVVGCRGRGGFKGLLLGSVSHQVAQHAPCPLVIVRAPAHEEDPEE